MPRQQGGARFHKSLLQRTLTNVAYLGKVRHHAEVYDGEHEAIVPLQLWQVPVSISRTSVIASMMCGTA